MTRSKARTRSAATGPGRAAVITLMAALVGGTATGGGSLAAASVFDLYGAGPRSAAMVGALSAAAEGSEAAFHNPALLADAVVGGAWAGHSSAFFDLAFQMQREVCTDRAAVCRGIYKAGYSAREPREPADIHSLQLGWHAPVGGIFRRRVVLGALLTLPYARILHISGPDPQQPHYYMEESLPGRMAVLVAVAARATDWLSFGVGVQVLAVLDAGVKLDADVTNHAIDEAAVQIGLRPIGRMTAGVRIRPMPSLRFGVGYRQELGLSYSIPSSISTGKSASLVLDVTQDTFYTPGTLVTGVGWQLLDGRLLVAAEIGLGLWSAAPDPSPRVAVDAGGPLINEMGLADALDIGRQTRRSTSPSATPGPRRSRWNGRRARRCGCAVATAFGPVPPRMRPAPFTSSTTIATSSAWAPATAGERSTCRPTRAPPRWQVRHRRQRCTSRLPVRRRSFHAEPRSSSTATTRSAASAMAASFFTRRWLWVVTSEPLFGHICGSKRAGVSPSRWWARNGEPFGPSPVAVVHSQRGEVAFAGPIGLARRGVCGGPVTGRAWTSRSHRL